MAARGLPAAHARWATAMAPSCSEVVPYRSMCRRAHSAYRMFGLTAPDATLQPDSPRSERPREPPHAAPARSCGFSGVSAKTQATVVAAPAAMAWAAWVTITPAVAPNALTSASRSSSPSASTLARLTPTSWLMPWLTSSPSTSRSRRPASATASRTASAARLVAERPYTFPSSVIPSPAIAAPVTGRSPDRLRGLRELGVRVPDLPPGDLAARHPFQRVVLDDHVPGHLVAGQPLPAERDDRVGGEGSVGADDGGRHLAELGVGRGNHTHLAHLGQLADQRLDLRGRHVVAARDDDVLEPVDDPDVPVGVLDADVAAVEPAVAHGLGVGRLVAPVAGRDARTGDDDLARLLRLAVRAIRPDDLVPGEHGAPADRLGPVHGLIRRVE